MQFLLFRLPTADSDQILPGGREEKEEGEGGGGGGGTGVLPNLVDKFVARGEPCAPSHSRGGSGVGVGAPSTAQHKHVDTKAGLFVQGIAIDFVLNTFCSATGVSGLCPL